MQSGLCVQLSDSEQPSDLGVQLSESEQPSGLCVQLSDSEQPSGLGVQLSDSEQPTMSDLPSFGILRSCTPSFRNNLLVSFSTIEQTKTIRSHLRRGGCSR